MTVKQLIELLSRADPADRVIVDQKTGCLLILGVRAGLHQSFEDDEIALQLTDSDKEFLRSMRIPI
jgi:hypothetical protein